MEEIFIDSGAFIALLANKDEHHQYATKLYAGLIERHVPLFATNHIVDETCTHLLYHYLPGHESALRFRQFLAKRARPIIAERLEILYGDRLLFIVYSTPEIEEEVWRILARYDNAGFSFTDCVSFAVMQSLGIRKAFTFDKHFETMGFEML